MSEGFAALYINKTLPVAPGLLGHVFDRIVEDGLLASLFYDGGVRTRDEFLDEMSRPGTLPFVVMRGKDVAAFSWFNCILGRSARAHFAIFREFWGRKIRVSLGRNFYRYVLSRKDAEGHLFDCVYGITPENNPLAWKTALQSGWRLIGTIPSCVFLADTKMSVGGVVTAATREILGIAEGEVVEATWDA